MREHRDAGVRFRGTTGRASDAYARAVEGVRRAHRELYTSADADAPGNWLYGDVWADAFWDGTKAGL